MIRSLLLVACVALTTASPTALEATGRWRGLGSFTWDISLSADGRTAYVSNAARGLVIFDVTRRGPVLLSQTKMQARGHAFDGTHMYVFYPYALHVVDVCDPSKPELLTVVKESFLDAVRFDSYLYVVPQARKSVVVVYDVSDPKAPTMKGEFAATTTAASLSIVGGHLYVGASLKIAVFDLSDPSSPRPSHALSTTDVILRIRQQGDRAYAVHPRGAVVLDVADPSTPTVAATWDGERLLGDLMVSDVAAVGNTAYVSGVTVGHTPFLFALDITDLKDPKVTGTYNTEGSGIDFPLAVHESRVYLGANDLTVFASAATLQTHKSASATAPTPASGGTPAPRETGVRMNGVVTPPIPVSGATVMLSGMEWTGFQPWMGGMTAHEVPAPVPAMSTVELTCGAGEVCEFFVALYVCSGCTGPRPAGFAHTLVLDGWSAGSCSPQFGDGFRTTGFWRKVGAGGADVSLTYTVGDDEIMAVFKGVGGTAPEPWCAKLHGPYSAFSAGPGCSARCPGKQ